MNSVATGQSECSGKSLAFIGQSECETSLAIKCSTPYSAKKALRRRIGAHSWFGRARYACLKYQYASSYLPAIASRSPRPIAAYTFSSELFIIPKLRIRNELHGK